MKIAYTQVFLLSFICLLIACTDSRKFSDSNAAVEQRNANQANGQPPTATRWVVTKAGIDGVRAGMTVAQAKSVWAGELVVLSGVVGPCYYLKPAAAPTGVAFMVVNEQIARIDVDNPSIATATGARIGDSEERIRQLYPEQVEVTPHKYTDGHYLMVIPGDSEYRILFETDGEKVTRYRVGRLPEVRWVEGCS